MKKFIWIATFVLICGGLAVLIMLRLPQEQPSQSRTAKQRNAIPVEVADIRQGPIAWQRTFTGTLEASSAFVVSPKVSGRVERLHVDLSDPVERLQVVAELDDAEYVQEVVQSRAEVAVAQANLAQAKSLLEISERELIRVEKLRKQRITSESELDAARADKLAKATFVDVAQAELQQSQSALELKRIRLSYTQVTANWRLDQSQRVVAQRFVDEGQTVSANTPLLEIVTLHPILAVFYVTEKDYARIHKGQTATLITDTFAGQIFSGSVKNVAPVFVRNTRQAQVELEVPNPDFRLKPGMFARITLILEQIPQATLVPELALSTRQGKSGVFVLNEGASSVLWNEVEVGIRQDGMVQLRNSQLSGKVVTLGQQFLEHQTEVILPQSSLPDNS